MTTNLLPSERNTRTTEQAVLRAYRRHTGRRPRLQADFEHGHWWVTELESGRHGTTHDDVPDCTDEAELLEGDRYGR